MKKAVWLVGLALFFCADISSALAAAKPMRPENLSRAKIAVDFGDSALGWNLAQEMIKDSLARGDMQGFIQGSHPCERGKVLCMRYVDMGNPRHRHRVEVMVFITTSTGDVPLMLTEGGCMAAPGQTQNAVEEDLIELQLLDSDSFKKRHPQRDCTEAWLPEATKDIKNAFGF
jgi:hypothetical protein